MRLGLWKFVRVLSVRAHDVPEKAYRQSWHWTERVVKGSRRRFAIAMLPKDRTIEQSVNIRRLYEHTQHPSVKEKHRYAYMLEVHRCPRLAGGSKMLKTNIRHTTESIANRDPQMQATTYAIHEYRLTRIAK